MAEAVDTIVENTQACNCASLYERGTEHKCFDGVGNTTTNHLPETTNSRKRSGGSSTGKVRMHFPLNVSFALEVFMFFLNGLAGFVIYVKCLAWNEAIILWARRPIPFEHMCCLCKLFTCIYGLAWKWLLNHGIHVVELVGRIQMYMHREKNAQDWMHTSFMGQMMGCLTSPCE